ncbi:MAG: dicarboxylate/amino acid:cation symporter [Legionellaceae bacterium]|nr:dicarboxylate/amino acid:cation symporter [Legionellaceae bacterium]
MCAQTATPSFGWTSPLALYTLMIGLGLLAGYSDSVLLHTTAQLISDVFVKLFKCISLPVIALSIIVTLSNYRRDGSMQFIWQRTMLYTFGTTFVAASVSFILYLLIAPESIHSGAPIAAEPLMSQHSYLDYVTNIVPASFLTPFIEHQVMSVLLLSLLLGFAIPHIPDEKGREALIRFFKGSHGLVMVLTQWLIRIIPLALFGFIGTTVTELRADSAVYGIMQYLAVIVLANVVQGFIILPLWLKRHGIAPYQALRKMMPALSLAFFTKSSVGTLPVTMDTIERNLGVRPSISRFILPLCTSLNMNGCAAFIFTTVIYLMQNHGISITVPMMMLWVFIAVIAAIGNAGVPMGCFFLSASLLSGMDVPIKLMSIILPFYSVIDMLETAVNVWSDACVTKVVDQSLQDTSLAVETLGEAI